MGTRELTSKGKSSDLLVSLLADDNNRSNVAQQDEDRCEQTVLEVAYHDEPVNLEESRSRWIRSIIVELNFSAETRERQRTDVQC